jgi:hypothetical protein
MDFVSWNNTFVMESQIVLLAMTSKIVEIAMLNRYLKNGWSFATVQREMHLYSFDVL